MQCCIFQGNRLEFWLGHDSDTNLSPVSKVELRATKANNAGLEIDSDATMAAVSMPLSTSTA